MEKFDKSEWSRIELLKLKNGSVKYLEHELIQNCEWIKKKSKTDGL